MLSVKPKRLPLRVTNCPIAEAIIEVRFDKACVPRDALFGIIFRLFESEYPKTTRLPGAELPDSVRESDIDLKFIPHHRVFNDRYGITLGPNAIAIAAGAPYSGWSDFRAQIVDIFGRISEAKVFDSPVRLGMRYLNFFEFDATRQLTVGVRRDQSSLIPEKVSFRVGQTIEGLSVNLHVDNNAKKNRTIHGTVVDIDIHVRDLGPSLLDAPLDTLERAHTLEKEVFYSVLSDELLETLNPEY